jgi:PadR family transcriptional regulator PadR
MSVGSEASNTPPCRSRRATIVLPLDLTREAVSPATADLEFKRTAIELLVLKSVSWGPMHGYAIAKWIQDTTDDALRVEEGSLYPALHRLEDKELIEAKWGVSDTKRQAKFYSLTARGRLALRTEIDSWTRFSIAIAKVIAAKRRPA